MNTAYQPPKTDLVTDVESFDPPLLSAKGRMGRLRYIAHSMWISLVVYIVLGGIGILAMTVLRSEAVAAVFMLANACVLLAIQFILTIKRCHDFNASGWFSILIIVPLVVIVFWLIPGTDGQNRFGPPPSKNTPLIVAGGLILPIVFILGILAAIAIPAYQGYAERARSGDALATPPAMHAPAAHATLDA